MRSQACGNLNLDQNANDYIVGLIIPPAIYMYVPARQSQGSLWLYFLSGTIIINHDFFFIQVHIWVLLHIVILQSYLVVVFIEIPWNDYKSWLAS